MPTAADAYQPQKFTHDLWVGLGHIIGSGSGDASLDRPAGSPQWVDTVDARRQAAYKVLSAILDNSRRYFLPPGAWERGPVEFATLGRPKIPLAPAERFREYGDADVLVDTARSLVLGETQAWDVPADHADHEAATEWLDAWDSAERVWAKIHAGERDTIGQGDAVYALGWSPSVRRPRLRAYNPGMYFPDWSKIDDPTYQRLGWDDDDFPPVVHVAWDREVSPGTVVLHRETWRMLPADAWTTPYGTQALWRCWRSVDEWPIERLRADDTVYNLPLPGSGGGRGGIVVLPPTDLGIDFLPVVHVPNDTAYVQHRWGRSILLRLVQILDDVAQADSDLAENAALVGSPTLVTAGAGTPVVGAGPGAEIGLPLGASAEYLDTSRNLDALLKQRDSLLSRLLTNARIVPAVLGHVAPDKVPSGYALRLGFSATEALVREIRGVRQDKLPLLPKMALRLAIANGALDIADAPPVGVDFGSALPADRAAAIDEVRTLLQDPAAISIRTAVEMLAAAGIPIEDVEAEVERIAADTISGRAAAAVDVVTALGEAEGLPIARRMLANPGDPTGTPPAPPVLNPPALPDNGGPTP